MAIAQCLWCDHVNGNHQRDDTECIAYSFFMAATFITLFTHLYFMLPLGKGLPTMVLAGGVRIQ